MQTSNKLLTTINSMNIYNAVVFLVCALIFVGCNSDQQTDNQVASRSLLVKPTLQFQSKIPRHVDTISMLGANKVAVFSRQSPWSKNYQLSVISLKTPKLLSRQLVGSIPFKSFGSANGCFLIAEGATSSSLFVVNQDRIEQRKYPFSELLFVGNGDLMRIDYLPSPSGTSEVRYEKTLNGRQVENSTNRSQLTPSRKKNGRKEGTGSLRINEKSGFSLVFGNQEVHFEHSFQDHVQHVKKLNRGKAVLAIFDSGAIGVWRLEASSKSEQGDE